MNLTIFMLRRSGMLKAIAATRPHLDGAQISICMNLKPRLNEGIKFASTCLLVS